MDNQFFRFIVILILIDLLEQIYRFWKKRVRPDLRKHYFLAKSDVAALYATPTIWNRITAAVLVYCSTLKSLVPILHRQISISIRSSEFLHRNFPAMMRHFQINRKREI